MKILVMSDTHGYLSNAERVITKLSDKVNSVFHLGDCDIDAYRLSKEFSKLEFYYVKGNNDYGTDTPLELIVSKGGKKFLLVHGHKHHVNSSYNSLAYVAEENNVDAVVFGHTHMPLNSDYNNILLFNPGSISRPRNTENPTFGIINISDSGIISATIMDYCGKASFMPSKHIFTT